MLSHGKVLFFCYAPNMTITPSVTIPLVIEREILYTGAWQNDMKDITRILMIVAGTVCVALGVIGMFFPILPTTPFLLLAAFLYARSSRRFYTWLLTNRWFGAYIRNYREGKGLPLKQKVLTLILLWLSIIYAAGFVVAQWWLKLLLVGIACGVTFHLVRIKNYRPEPRAPTQDEGCKPDGHEPQQSSA